MKHNSNQPFKTVDLQDPRKLRILHVVPTYFPAVRYGGPIRSVHALAVALVHLGHEVHVFTSSVDGPTNLAVQENAPVNLDGVLIHYFRVPCLRRLYWSPSMYAALRASVSTFDLVHLHSVFLWPTWAAARLAKAAGVPYILTPRGSLGRAVIHGKNRVLKSLWIGLIEQRTIRESDAIHVTSELEGTEVRSLDLTLPAVCCVPNGVTAPPEHMTLAQDLFADLPRPYVLFLSRINWKKGLDRLIKSWKLVPGLTLVIAGNDEEKYQSYLVALAEEEAVSSRVHFIGQVSDEHKWALFANAMMFVLPSYSENFGNVVAEAMATGCPVIVTKEVGLASFVLQAGAGIVVDGDPVQLAEAMTHLSNSESLRRRLGMAGQIAVRENLSWPSVAKRMEALYMRTILQHRPQTRGRLSDLRRRTNRP